MSLKKYRKAGITCLPIYFLGKYHKELYFKQMNPKLKFVFNKILDFQIARNFYRSPEHGGINFWEDTTNIYIDLRRIDSIKNKNFFLDQFIKKIYENERIEMLKRKKQISKLYKENSKRFFIETAKIFKNHYWPEGKYICYFSIFDFGPRFLEDRTFQVYIFGSDKLVLFTIFHEMLHFAFYDYAIKKYPRIFKNLDTERGIFWDLAEIFNSIQHLEKGFIVLHGKVQDPCYLNHKKHLNKLQKLWIKDRDIDCWILKGFEHLKGYSQK